MGGGDGLKEVDGRVLLHGVVILMDVEELAPRAVKAVEGRAHHRCRWWSRKKTRRVPVRAQTLDDAWGRKYLLVIYIYFHGIYTVFFNTFKNAVHYTISCSVQPKTAGASRAFSFFQKKVNTHNIIIIITIF
jgi:hypothetical protein